MTAELDTRESPRYLAGTLGDLELTVYRDGVLTDPASAGTVTVTDADGTVLSTGSASVVGGGSGLLRYTPTAAAMANVNLLTVSWASVVLGSDPAITLTSYAEVVGDMLFTNAQARQFDEGALADRAKYPDDEIRRAHDRVMDAFETILGYPLGRRYYQEVVDGDGCDTLLLERGDVRSVRAVASRTRGSATWTAFTSDELADVLADRSLLIRETLGSFASGRQNIRVSYEAGRRIHPELRLAGLRLIRHQLVASNLPDRALYQTTSLGQFRFAVAGDGGRWFGIPEVDAVLMRHLEVAIA